ncbi:MAG: PBP1A family penicillin-binding protein [Spirochaetia bacterium]|nr:PBP1A family penicillin-binding protein [Spirochaetia bacterium]
MTSNLTEKQKKILFWVERTFFVGLFSGALIGGLLFGLAVREVAAGKDLILVSAYRPSTPTRLYDKNGRVFAELFRQRQELVQLQDIPPHVVQAFLSVEDDNYFNHIGLDVAGIIRAAVKNLISGKIRQGGSTLTQQVAKQIYLNHEGRRNRTVRQKIRETLLAFEIEEAYTKHEILEVFFNVIYLGHGCKGIACASRLYFGKKVQDLSVAEAALLARLPKSPVEYSPFKNPGEAMRQHKLVLNLMATNGYVPRGDVAKLHEKFWADYWPKVIVQSPSQNIWADRLDKAPYFTDYVRQILEASEDVGPENLYTGGLKIYTTLDLDHQRIAEEELLKQVAEVNKNARANAKAGGKGGVDLSLFGIFNQLALLFPVGSPSVQGLDLRGQFRKAFEEDMIEPTQLLGYSLPAYNETAAFDEFRKATVSYTTNLQVQGAFISIEPSSGMITSMVGGTEFTPQNQFNRALQARRQPGSAFKIFIYGAALEQRAISTQSALNDAPFFSIDAAGNNWSPGNYDEGFHGLMPAITAFALSINTCAIQVYYKLGPDPIIDFAQRLMKITNRDRFHPDPSLALGSSEVTPFEMAKAVAVIGNDGKDVIPFAVRYVTDQSGNVLYNQEENIRKILKKKTDDNTIQIIDPALAYLIRKMMEAVADHGTATQGVRSRANFTGSLAAKTGTTSSWSDAWIVGFNPDVAAAIWFGFDKSSVTLGSGQAGGYIASPTMGHFYRRIYAETKRVPPLFKDRPDKDAEPPGIIVAGCGGKALAPAQVGTKTLAVPGDVACAGEETRIYDQRELLMKEMGIKPEDIGGSGNIRFKNEKQ